MSLAPGTKLGPYEVISAIGSGGMGEVYRARDIRLGREVAIKVLPPELAADSSRLRRFEKEARAASSLNHPNIVTIHDVGEVNSIPYIAMELVDGKSLRELLADGALPLRRLVQLAAQIADGLARAHEEKIVHRDLKPENIMVAKEGFAKILDFGVAKLTQPEIDRAGSELMTVTKGTEPGIVMGTVGYMSPEQASGGGLDYRSDQFSFGSVLYEMSTGKPAFRGRTKPETLAAIIREEPDPIGALNPRVPLSLRWIIERCLAKDSRERYAATADLARDLAKVRDHISEVSGGEAALPLSRKRLTRERLAWGTAAAAVLLGIAAAFLAYRRGEERAAPLTMRLGLTFPAAESPVWRTDVPGPALALSPDGMRLVYVGRSAGGTQLYVRPMDRFEAAPIPGTENAMGPFFSPEGRWVGFWSDRKLKKVSLAGGQPLALCDAPALRGASWSADGTILFSPSSTSGLWRISDRGGEAKPLTTVDPAKGESTHRWPEILPGGRSAIFTIHGLSGNYDNARIGLVVLATGERRVLLEGGSQARYLPTGHLVYFRAGSLFAVPFDLNRLAITGPPAPVLDDVAGLPEAGFGHYTFSRAGNLVYLLRDLRRFETDLIRVDRNGVTRTLSEERRIYSEIRLSPDGRYLAAVAGAPESNIWIYDLARNSWARWTAGSENISPVWAPDSQRIAFASNRKGSFNIFWAPVDRAQSAEQLTNEHGWVFPYSFSPDGRFLLLQTQAPETASDISVLSLDSDRRPQPVLQTPSYEEDAVFSPDGRWIAYVSDESGRPEVSVMGYPAGRDRIRISTEGGKSPVWSRNGRELFYYSSAGKLMAVAVETRQEFKASLPKPLFQMENLRSYDVTPNGQEFIAIRPAKVPDTEMASLAVVLGWFDDVKRRVAAEKQSQ